MAVDPRRLLQYSAGRTFRCKATLSKVKLNIITSDIMHVPHCWGALQRLVSSVRKAEEFTVVNRSEFHL